MLSRAPPLDVSIIAEASIGFRLTQILTLPKIVIMRIRRSNSEAYHTVQTRDTTDRIHGAETTNWKTKISGGSPVGPPRGNVLANAKGLRQVLDGTGHALIQKREHHPHIEAVRELRAPSETFDARVLAPP